MYLEIYLPLPPDINISNIWYVYELAIYELQLQYIKT